MKISIEHFSGQYPSFNIHLHSKEGATPFLTIKGCKIIQGQNGPFISYPARKQENGKYWNHVYGSDNFNQAVIDKARQQSPRQAPAPRQAPSHDAFKARQLRDPMVTQGGSGFDDMDSDIAF